jgi:hypothetical protein
VFVDRVVELAASTTVNVFAQRGHLAAGFFGHGSSSLVSVGAITPLIVPWGHGANRVASSTGTSTALMQAELSWLSPLPLVPSAKAQATTTQPT